MQKSAGYPVFQRFLDSFMQWFCGIWGSARIHSVKTKSKKEDIMLNRHPYEEIHRKRGLFFQIGLVASLGMVILAFQWKGPERKAEPLADNYEEPVFVMEDLPRTKIHEEIPQINEQIPDRKVIRLQEMNIIEVDHKLMTDNLLDSVMDFEDLTTTLVQPVDTVAEEAPRVPFRIVEEMPEFPGGARGIYQYLASHIRYPEPERSMGIEGTVFLQFVVDETGQVTDVTVLRGVSRNLDEEAVRAVEQMPRWKPGKQRGRPVPVYYTVDVKFVIYP